MDRRSCATFATRLARAELSGGSASAIACWKNAPRALAFYQLSRRRPELVKVLLRKGLERQLPAGYDIDRHFTPRYDPWDQRLCLVPDGDLFTAISEGEASIVTDQIEM